MATKQETVDFILDQLRNLPNIRMRKMFGEYALYVDEKVVGLVCDDQLFVKITPEGKEHVGDDYQEGSPYPGAKPYMLIEERLDNSEFLTHLLSVTADSLPVPKLKKKKVKEIKLLK